jgi:hypothetical protein
MIFINGYANVKRESIDVALKGQAQKCLAAIGDFAPWSEFMGMLNKLKFKTNPEVYSNLGSDHSLACIYALLLLQLDANLGSRKLNY